MMHLRNLKNMAKQQFKRQKSSNTKSKNPPKNLHKPIRVLVDGITEEDYFKHLNNLEVYSNITFKPKIGKEKDLLRWNQKQETAFLIIDIDNHGENPKSNEFMEIERVLKSYPDQVYFSNFSFETWILLHKTHKIPYAIKKDDYDRKMKLHFRLPDNWSTKKDEKQRKLVMGKLTKKHFDDALKNACIIENDNYRVSPSTNMNIFFSKISELNKDCDK